MDNKEHIYISWVVAIVMDGLDVTHAKKFVRQLFKYGFFEGFTK